MALLGYALHFSYTESLHMQLSEFVAYTQIAKDILEKTHGL
ncbi:hypothetical protein NHP190012_11510 [Helicobacter sp. NHP19-012]|uniref:Uncharacterized protein n=1 Tax=Helicobacter gastrofelis TaxID=2849642 RepID=A0ABN6I7D4_9HELI|nr:hypothetical protein [Helicobacter sp. NHP19-012]BCZ19509.1 hypothetical protein NHP190012_11510 [Helicobacter sp. NHP19-012]